MRTSLCLIARDAPVTLINLIENLRPGLLRIDEIVVVDTGAGGSAAAAREALQAAGYAGTLILDVQGPTEAPDWFLAGGPCGACEGRGEEVSPHGHALGVCRTCLGSRLDPETSPLLADFARARNHAFGLATGDWRGWLDADDEVSHPDLFAALPREADAAVDCIVLPYLYAVTGDGKPVIQQRERWVRWGSGGRWRWEGRVHEVLQRQDQGSPESVQQARKPLIAHRGEVIQREAATRARNRVLLTAQAQDPIAPDALRYRARAYLALDAGLDGRIDKADAWLTPLRAHPDRCEAVPGEIAQRAHALVVQGRRARTVQSISILAVGSPLAWHARSPEEGGCGGSEEAVVYVARGLADLGLDVRVYGCAKRETVDGVDWHAGNDWTAMHRPDLVLAWRSALGRRVLREGQRAILWAHDVHVGRCDREDLASFEAIWSLSAFQERLIGEAYPGAWLPPFWRLGNGLPGSAWVDPAPQRDPLRVVYVSSPDRGLDRLLDLWPAVREAVPAATLHVFYGWDTFDAAWGAAPASADRDTALAFKARVVAQVAALEQAGVIWRGRVGQADLARELAGAGVLAYPSSFDEVFCISAVRAEAAGLAIVATDTGSLREVVTWPDALVSLPWNDQTRDDFTARLIDALRNPPTDAERQAQARAARRWTWDRAVDGLLRRLRAG